MLSTQLHGDDGQRLAVEGLGQVTVGLGVSGREELAGGFVAERSEQALRLRLILGFGSGFKVRG
jgi:hypothetical protein